MLDASKETGLEENAKNVR